MFSKVYKNDSWKSGLLCGLYRQKRPRKNGMFLRGFVGVPDWIRMSSEKQTKSYCFEKWLV